MAVKMRVCEEMFTDDGGEINSSIGISPILMPLLVRIVTQSDCPDRVIPFSTQVALTRTFPILEGTFGIVHVPSAFTLAVRLRTLTVQFSLRSAKETEQGTSINSSTEAYRNQFIIFPEKLVLWYIMFALTLPILIFVYPLRFYLQQLQAFFCAGSYASIPPAPPTADLYKYALTIQISLQEGFCN